MPRANVTLVDVTPSVEREDALDSTARAAGNGTLPDGKAFDFHARGKVWALSVGATIDDVVSAPEWRWSEPYGDRMYEAGYMSEEIARAIIESCAEMYVARAAPPVEYAGASSAELVARRLALALREDLRLYARDPESRVWNQQPNRGARSFLCFWDGPGNLGGPWDPCDAATIDVLSNVGDGDFTNHYRCASD